MLNSLIAHSVVRSGFAALILFVLVTSASVQAATPGTSIHTYTDTGELSESLSFTVSTAQAPASPLVGVPNPLSGDNPTYKLSSVSVPTPGQSVPDPEFGTTQIRVTQTEMLRHEYSRHDPFNKDQSMVVLIYVPHGEWRVYRTQTIPYDQSANLVTTLSMEEPRWDPIDPNLIWGLQEFRIVTVNVQTDQTTTIKDFSQDSRIGPVITANPDVYRITTKDEGESSLDKRFWAFLLQGTQEDYRPRYVFTWDRQTDQVLGVYEVSASQADIDWVGMSSKGTWVLIGGSENNSGDLAGLVMANKELTQFHRLDFATAHSDVGLDSQGNEVIVMQNVRTDHIDLIPIDWGTQPILETGGSYANTNRTPLVRLFYDSDSSYGLNSGVHISCNAPGYCVISTFIEPNLPEQNWLDRKIILIKLDTNNPQAFYLAKVYGTRGEYWEEAQASITHDGKRVVWATNWNQNVGQERVWLMQLDMPTGWMSSPGPPPPLPPPPAPPGGSLESFDRNNNNLIDDPEIFAVIDAWIAGQMDEATFFRAIDLWVSQQSISLARSGPTTLTVHSVTVISDLARHTLTFAVKGQRIASMAVEVYDLNGRSLANGVYFYIISVQGYDGKVIRSEVKKLVILK